MRLSPNDDVHPKLPPYLLDYAGLLLNYFAWTMIVVLPAVFIYGFMILTPRDLEILTGRTEPISASLLLFLLVGGVAPGVVLLWLSRGVFDRVKWKILVLVVCLVLAAVLLYLSPEIVGPVPQSKTESIVLAAGLLMLAGILTFGAVTHEA